MIGKIEKKYSTVSSQEKVAKIIEWLEAKKASDVVVLDLEGVNSFTDAVVIATVKSVRQSKALAEEISKLAKGENYEHLEKTPPELASDIAEHGLLLAGGGALLKGLNELIMQETGLQVIIDDDPLTTVVRGTGKTLDDRTKFSDVYIN